jgi:predicted acylesterase/phospholipase RssA
MATVRKARKAQNGLPWKAAAVLTADAPTSPLMAGALAAIYERNRTYDFIFSSGSGSLIGLSLVAPKGKTPPDALHGLIDLMVADPVYRTIPLDHKVFFKAGPWSELFRRLTPYYQIRNPRTPAGKVFNDRVSQFISVLAPTTLNYFSKGLCNPNPWIEEFVDFDKVKAFLGHFTVNAYNITTGEMEPFDKRELTADHIRAATACPFIYPPFKLGNSYYYEGADVDPINLPKLLKLAGVKHPSRPIDGQGQAGVRKPGKRVRVDDDDEVVGFNLKVNFNRERLFVVVFDVLGSLEPRALTRVPRNLLDAYAISLATPLRSIVREKITTFESEIRALKKVGQVEMEIVRFDIPERYWPNLIDWSESNAKRLWHIGYERGKKLVSERGHQLAIRAGDNASPVS